MRHFIGAAMAVTLVVGAAASKLNVMDPSGKKVGTATYSFIQGGEKLSTRLILTMTEQGANVTMDMTNVYSSAGNPMTQLVKISAALQGNKFESSAKATFAGRKATVVTTAMGKTETKSATAPGSVADQSIVWIGGRIPAVGTKSTAYEFNPMNVTWKKTVSTYHGLRTVKLGSRSVSAHVLTSTQGDENTKVYFTAKGDLIKLESKQFNLIQQ
ncbi:MAG: hypothetical protein M3R13_05015 [Armatimonadota bacterium]|nr:hypothetical protein [Armatimonadota bacterium]